jgi:RNA polymerase sigma factor (sigma-70 family)
VYTARRTDLARFLIARLGNREDAEDVLQELYLKVSRATADDVIDPAAYLYRMAMNLARDFRRGAARGRARDAGWAEASHTMVGTDAKDDMPSPESALAAKQRLAQVRLVLDGLSPQTRRIFVLHKIEGRSHQEIATALGISKSSVEKHMHAALQRLIARLGRN